MRNQRQNNRPQPYGNRTIVGGGKGGGKGDSKGGGGGATVGIKAQIQTAKAIINGGAAHPKKKEISDLLSA